MSRGLWKILLPPVDDASRPRRTPRLALGDTDEGPADLLSPDLDLDTVLASGDQLARIFESPGTGPVPPGSAVLAPIGAHEVWAAGVTFERSRAARMEEAAAPDHYDLVYEAKRPELFVKAMPGRCRGTGQAIGIRADSTWDVPEPELAVVASASGTPIAYTIGNDVSSRSIEAENPLYLPQAKIYAGSCALGPCLVPAAALPALGDMAVTLTIARAGEAIFSDTVGLAAMRRRPEELLSWLQRAYSVPSGVVLLTGTSIVPDPQLTLHPGDLVTIAITGLGQLINTVELVGNPS